ncbi:putative decarboxylase DEC1 [Boeremia exigua]|uniref:putative decarboxylase DEC1 n=1 Tax=Boeremia exigua TaxID=749465 RepID=UPI001E8DA1AD|nr:putative decarboxylase DEC1 [Boeremia exigua]KAH6620579.1 putative decarboxylase DEC1 [Boeremia exigua]
MPFGQLAVTNAPIPQDNPPIRGLVPDVLEVDDEPLVTATLLRYGTGPSGPFNELIHTVEARYRGTTYASCLSLLLDLEAGVLAGREPFGFPKRLGAVSLTPSAPHAATGRVERPAGHPLAEFRFQGTAQQSPPRALDKPFLNLRVIPSPVAGAPASVKELVPCAFEIRPAEVWDGVGELVFPDGCPQAESLNRVEVLRYEGSTLAYGARCVLRAAEEVFQL